MCEEGLTKEDRFEYAAMMLAWYLADGPKPCGEVIAFCNEMGITGEELEAARRDLNMRSTKVGDVWCWYVPDPEENA